MRRKRKPGEVRDAILAVLSTHPYKASIESIQRQVTELIGKPAPSSVRSYLRLNTPSTFVRTARAQYALKEKHGNQRARVACCRFS